jgi:hypothetical protein
MVSAVGMIVGAGPIVRAHEARALAAARPRGTFPQFRGLGARGGRALATLGPMKTNAAIGNHPWVRFGATALAALGLASLSACTGGSTPIVTETPSPTATSSATLSPSPSLSPTPLTDAELLALMPPEAAYPDVRGAIATAQFFLDEFQRMYLTGDEAVWIALSVDGCEFCSSSRTGAAALHNKGGRQEGGEFTVDPNAIEANIHEQTGFTYVILHATWAPTQNVYSDGRIEPDGDGGAAQISFEMELRGNAWRVRGVGVESTA